MIALPGDWLVVPPDDATQRPREGLILEAQSLDGSPPYLVYWVEQRDTELVHPGPDAQIRDADRAGRSGNSDGQRSAT